MAENKEYWVAEEDQGTIRISEDAIASIAGVAAAETEGVSELHSGFANDIVSFISKNKKNMSKGIRIELGEADTVRTEINILVLFGFNIREVAQKTQENVKNAIESMTGLKVTEVDIHVSGVAFEDKTEETSIEE